MIKIISIHVPKTAGRSFYHLLKWAYGNKLDEPRNRDAFVSNGRFNENLIHPETEVLHGHFTYAQIRHLHENHQSALIVWLRDPVSRVISNYYYNIRMNQLKPWKPRAEIRTRLSLMEFAAKPGQINTMSRILKGIQPESLFFAGIMERYDKDLRILAEKLTWPEPLPHYHINPGTSNYENPEAPTLFTDITEKMREEIRRINQEDWLLYEKCRNLNADS